MENNKDLTIQITLQNIQRLILQIGLFISLAGFVYEIGLKRNIQRSLALNVSLIGTIALAAVLIICTLITGLKQDKTQTREAIIKSSKAEPVYKYMAAHVFYVKYRTLTITYSVTTVIALAFLITAMRYQEHLYFTIPVALSTVFLSQLSGIAKSANKIPIFPTKYREELKDTLINSELANEEGE